MPDNKEPSMDDIDPSVSKLQDDLDNIPHKGTQEDTHGSVPHIHAGQGEETLIDKVVTAGLDPSTITDEQLENDPHFQQFKASFTEQNMEVFRKKLEPQEYALFHQTHARFKELIEFVDSMDRLGLPPELMNTMDSAQAGEYLRARGVWQGEALIALHKAKMMTQKALFDPMGI